MNELVIKKLVSFSMNYQNDVFYSSPQFRLSVLLMCIPNALFQIYLLELFMLSQNRFGVQRIQI